jgi:purine nucleoside permease
MDMRPAAASLPVLLLFAGLLPAQQITITPVAPPKIPIKAVVVTMFEIGKDTGDRPGELQNWVEREKLDRILPAPYAYHDLRMNEDGVLAVLTGMGTARASAAITALGMDPRFDLSKAYWLVAGIAGADPADASLGSAAWAEWVIDGDLGYEIDAREVPKDWKTGFIPFRRKTPYEQPHKAEPGETGEAYHLNAKLVDWAFNLTKGLELGDSEDLKKGREPYAEAAARKAPFVLKGDTISSTTFWHGRLLEQWANDWTKYHTDGAGNYVTTGMEDTGTLQALTFLSKDNRVDINRVLVLRTVSNFDAPPPGITATDGMARNANGNLAAFNAAVENAWKVGHVVVKEIVQQWPKYRDQLPGVQ